MIASQGCRYKIMLRRIVITCNRVREKTERTTESYLEESDFSFIRFLHRECILSRQREYLVRPFFSFSPKSMKEDKREREGDSSLTTMYSA